MAQGFSSRAQGERDSRAGEPVDYADYASDSHGGRRRLFGDYKVAAVIMAVVMLLSTGFGARRSLSADRARVESIFVEGVYRDGNSIYRSLTDYAAVASDLLTVARRNMGAFDNAGLLDKLEESIGWLREIAASPESYDAYRNLSDLCYEVAVRLSEYGTDERDARYLQNFRADFAGLADMIERDGFNGAADEFNTETLGRFPANILAAATGVRPVRGFR